VRIFDLSFPHTGVEEGTNDPALPVGPSFLSLAEADPVNHYQRTQAQETTGCHNNRNRHENNDHHLAAWGPDQPSDWRTHNRYHHRAGRHE
jgi:hypothetical protein